MIKIMDRSLWYYIKRPWFSYSLYLSKPAIRMYSLFVMDLIEQDILEYRDIFQFAGSKDGWYIKGTDQKINQNMTLYYIDELLKKKKYQIDSAKMTESSKQLIAKQLAALQGKNEEQK